jgi:transcriptional regulator with GAF, ATPase, and Fis domain
MCANDTVSSSTERDGPGITPSPASAVRVLHCPVRALVGRRLGLGKELRFGRVASADVDMAIDDPKMSRRHATLTRAGLVVELRDDGSSNGTHVNGARIRTGVLVPGDIIRMGETLLELADASARVPSVAPTLIGSAAAFLAAVELADRVAASDLPVLLLGETGTGKDVLACHIHAQSGRTGSFVAVNCAALPAELVEAALFGHKKGAFTGAASDSPGFFVQAQGGSLFLDEVGELAVAHQAKLLRALDAREIIPVGGTRSVRVDVRVLAATNVELLDETGDGGFRADLYARLAGAVVRMPPLRARRCDVLVLAEHLLGRESLGQGLDGYRFSVQAAERLLLHPWPRNVRELATAMRRLRLEVGERREISRADIDAILELPVMSVSKPPSGRGARTTAPAREELVAQLSSLRGNVTRLAERYGKDGKQIYRWLKRYGLDPEDYR